MIKDKNLEKLEKFAKLAEDVPRTSGAKIVAGLYIKNKLISIGTNSLKSSPFYMHFGKNNEAIFAHAETDAIKQAIAKYSENDIKEFKTTLYVARVKQDAKKGPFQWALSRPCDGCRKCIETYKINSVYYTIDTNEYGTF